MIVKDKNNGLKQTLLKERNMTVKHKINDLKQTSLSMTVMSFIKY